MKTCGDIEKEIELKRELNHRTCDRDEMEWSAGWIDALLWVLDREDETEEIMETTTIEKEKSNENKS